MIMNARLGIAAPALFLIACGGTQSGSSDSSIDASLSEMIATNMAPISEYEVEEEEGVDGETWWEVEAVAELEIYFAEDGSIPKFEARVPFYMVPEAALQAADNAAGADAERLEAELALFGELIVWELEYDVGGDDELDVYVNSDGSLYEEYGSGEEIEVEEGDSNAIQARFAEAMAPITDFEVEMEAGQDGATWYEVEYEEEIEVYFRADGTNPKYEARIPFSMVPEAAMEAAMEAAPEGAEPVAAELVILLDELMWEVEFMEPGADDDIDIYVTSEGEILREY